MALNNLGLGFIFTAKDRASAVIQGVNRNMGTLSKTSAGAGMSGAGALIGIGAAAGTMAAGVAGVGKAFQLADMSGQFEQQLATVGAITQAGVQDMAMLKNAAIEAGLATKFTPAEAVEGLKALSVQGFNATEASTALRSALDLAAGGQISIADASATTAAALRVFSMDANQANVAADKLLAITNRTALQANDLALALGNISRGAVSTKQDLSEMLISIGLVRNTGVEASVASSSVSSALLFMAKNAKQFKALGVELEDSAGNFRKFNDIVLDTKQALDQIPGAAARVDKTRELFGRFGITAYTAISNQLAAGVKDANGQVLKLSAGLNSLRQSQEDSVGRAAEFVQKQLDTWKGQRELLKGAAETVRILGGEVFAALFRPAVEAVYAVTTNLAKAFAALPSPLKKLLGATFLFGSALLIVVGAAVMLKLLLILLAPFLLVLVKVALIAVGAMLALAAAVAAVGLAFYGVWLAAKHNIAGMGDFFTGLKEKVTTVWNALKELFTTGQLSFGTEAILRSMGLLGFVQAVGYIAKKGLALWEGLKVGFMAGLRAIEPAWNELKQAILEVGSVIGLVTEDFAMAGGGADSMQAKGVALGRVLANLVGMMVSVVSWTLLIGSAFVRAGLWIKEVFGDAVLGVTVILRGLWILLQNIGQALLFITTLGGAGEFVSFKPLVTMVEEHDQAMAQQRSALSRFGVGAGLGPTVPRAQPHPASSYVEGTSGRGGVAAITPGDIENATANGMSRALAGTPISLKGDANGEALFNMISNIQRDVRNRGGDDGTPVPPGFQNQ